MNNLPAKMALDRIQPGRLLVKAISELRMRNICWISDNRIREKPIPLFRRHRLEERYGFGGTC
jgi:hypothetical protein